MVPPLSGHDRPHGVRSQMSDLPSGGRALSDAFSPELELIQAA